MTIEIVLPKKTGKGVKCSNGTKVFSERGREIKNITSINISIETDDIITATVNVAIDSIANMDNIHALLGTETLERIAELHGFKLVKI